MPDCPLADDCPRFTEQIEGMGCQSYGDRSGMEWCSDYDQPISDLKTQPVKPGEEIVVEVTDIHESGAGVGRTEDGFIVMVDGVLPDARARVKVTNVHSNHARADELERLPLEEEAEGDSDAEMGPEEADADEVDADEDDDSDDSGGRRVDRERLGSRENFWGN
ncbi:TRAM domain-containing protein [Halorubellus sp. JP-L1]|uniref:TRAM domain-containing protein n=1 Tax=Halorubellus sp. JP-L1 TaxID=2715753 RepID=UPI00140BABFF|nr:TRAM domain-containing protein [Halorubellus sp. JP-L1]NHN41885.1 TRAM domain-containing protein [Halorubellus sp. JP-L1]